MNDFSDYLGTISRKMKAVDLDKLNQAAQLIVSTSRMGKKIIIIGNGGSAAIASHVTVDLTKNAKIRSINFNEADLLTCFSNDYGYDRWVEKALAFYADGGDLAILISSSGQSKNILNGAGQAKSMGLKRITFSGFSPDNPLRQQGDINFWVDSSTYNVVEMIHNIWLLAIVDHIIGNIVYISQSHESLGNR
jgi:D-sedoheptulose 7-phosphate isomerase